MKCIYCKKEYRDKEIAYADKKGFVEIPGIRKYWCVDCWE